MAKTVEGSPSAAPPLNRALVERLASLVTAAEGRRTQGSFSPFDGSLIGEVPTCTAEDVIDAVSRARAAQRAWAGCPLAERSKVMLAYHDLVLDRQEQSLHLVQTAAG